MAIVCGVQVPEQTKSQKSSSGSEKTETSVKAHKRWVDHVGYGFAPSVTSYSNDYGFAGVDFGHEVHSTHVITKEVGVPVPHPVAVPVDRPVPYAVKVIVAKNKFLKILNSKKEADQVKI